MHVLDHKHEYCFIQYIMELITPPQKRTCMNCLESYCMQTYHQWGLLIEEQHVNGLDLLYNIARDILPPHTEQTSYRFIEIYI
jgi:hypothetical protein